MMLSVAPLLLVVAQATVAAATPTPTPSPAAAPKAAPAAGGPTVVLETTMGNITIALDKAKAPVSVDNFLKYVREGHYDGTVFHRVIPGFMVQGGGFDPDMKQRPTHPPIKNEASNGLSNARGTLAMARTNDPNSATSQFFINVVDNPRLDYGMSGAGYAVFGKVVEGMDVVDKIAQTPTGTKNGMGDVPKTPILIKKAHEAGAKGD
jgi:cyclophilin family peptidyl-prolyl cis-trans isomerase